MTRRVDYDILKLSYLKSSIGAVGYLAKMLVAREIAGRGTRYGETEADFDNSPSDFFGPSLPDLNQVGGLRQFVLALVTQPFCCLNWATRVNFPSIIAFELFNFLITVSSAFGFPLAVALG